MIATKKNLPYASMVHLKDFYVRPHTGSGRMVGLLLLIGNYLRGAIVGHGDIDMWGVLRIIKQSGYDGYLSIEFEGMEDCELGTKLGLDQVVSIWNEI